MIWVEPIATSKRMDIHIPISKEIQLGTNMPYVHVAMPDALVSVT
jgi:hypothetical protein